MFEMLHLYKKYFSFIYIFITVDGQTNIYYLDNNLKLAVKKCYFCLQALFLLVNDIELLIEFYSSS